MMLAFLEQPSEVDVFAFFLAHELKKTVSEVEQMPHSEYLHWSAYFKSRHAFENKVKQA